MSGPFSAFAEAKGPFTTVAKPPQGPFALAAQEATTKPPKVEPPKPAGLRKQLASGIQGFIDDTTHAIPDFLTGSIDLGKSMAQIAKISGPRTALRAFGRYSMNELRADVGLPPSKGEEDQSLAESLSTYKATFKDTGNLDALLKETFSGGLTEDEQQSMERGLLNLSFIVPVGGTPEAVIQGVAKKLASPIQRNLARKIAEVEMHSIASFVSWNAAQAAISGEDIGEAAKEGALIGAIAPPVLKGTGTVLGQGVKYGIKGVGVVGRPVGKVLDQALMRTELYRGARTFLSRVYDHGYLGVGRSGEGLLRVAGAAETADLAKSVRSSAHTLMAQWDTNTRAQFVGLSNKEANTLGAMLHLTPEEGLSLARQEGIKSPEMLAAKADKVKTEVRQVGEMAQELGIPQVDAVTNEARQFFMRADYDMPHVYVRTEKLLEPGKARDEAIHTLTSVYHKTQTEAEEILEQIHARATAEPFTPSHGMISANLQGRRYNLPGFVLDPRAVLPEYFANMARRIENFRAFGEPMKPPTVAPQIQAPIARAGSDIITKEQAAVMSADELEAAASKAISGEGDDAVAVFGPEKAKQYERAQRIYNDPNSFAFQKERYEAASKLIQEMEANLTPAQEQRLFGIGEPGMNAEDLKSAARVARDYAPENLTDKEMWSTADLMNVVGRELLTGHPYENLESAIRLQNTMQELASRGMGREAIEDAIKKRAIREGVEPDDAKMLLQSTMEKLRQNQAPKLSSPQPAIAAPEETATRTFGKTIQEQYPKAFEEISQITDPGRRELATKIMEHQLGGIEKGPVVAQMLSKAMGYEAVMKLGTSAFTQVSQIAGAVIPSGFHNSAQDLFSAMGKNPAVHDAAARTGAFAEALVRESEAEIAGSQAQMVTKTLRRIGFTGMDTFARRYGAIRGFSLASHQAEELARLVRARGKFGPIERAYTENQIAKIEKKFAQLGIDAAPVVARGGTLLPEEYLKAGQKLSTDVNFWSDSLSLPAWYKSPWGRVATQFKSFVYQQTKFMNEHVLKPAQEGDVGPLTRMLAAYGFSGEAIADVKSLVRNKPRKDQGVKRILADYAAAGAFGMISDITQATNFENGLVNLVGGPIASDAADIVYGVGKAARGHERFLGKKMVAVGVPYIATRIPGLAPFGSFFAPAITNTLYPPKGQ